MSVIVVAIGTIAFGIVLGYAGLRLFAEYRAAFFANPRGVMTLDVLVQILMCGSAPAYLAAPHGQVAVMRIVLANKSIRHFPSTPIKRAPWRLPEWQAQVRHVHCK